MRKIYHLGAAFLKSPIIWGAPGSVGFFALLEAGWLGDAFFQRYCAGHPVEYIETSLFFVGLAVLAIKAFEVAGQGWRLGKPVLGPIPRSGQTPADCAALRKRLDSVSLFAQNDYLVGRLRGGLDYVLRRDSSESLDDHLKYLADLDADRAHASYGLLRLVVWAIPILGFLGTVVGITMAIGSLNVNALEESLVDVMGGLGVAFDTTALALSLVTILMFVQFYVDRAENRLLDNVNRQVGAELVGRFPEVSSSPEGQVVAMRRMSEAMVASMEQLVSKQAQMWQASMESANERWSQMADGAGKQLQSALSGALAQSIKAHAQQMVAAEDGAAEKNRRHWGDVQQGLTRVAEVLTATQQAMVHKAEVLGRAVEGAAYVAKLEETLNRNLAALAGAENFEETVMSLAAAIHLLNARLAAPPAAPAVHLEGHRRTGHAA